jgi:hypothetical protein
MGQKLLTLVLSHFFENNNSSSLFLQGYKGHSSYIEIKSMSYQRHKYIETTLNYERWNAIQSKAFGSSKAL